MSTRSLHRSVWRFEARRASDAPHARRGRRFVCGAVAAITAAACLLASSPAAAADIAVVVHSDVLVDDVSFSELRKILLGDRQFWSSGQRIVLIVRAPVAAERTVLLEKVYEMNEAQFRRYWIAKVFRAEATTEPRVVVANTESIELVSVIHGAIALVDARDIPSGHKILSVDGTSPGDPEYPLRFAEPDSSSD